jgi:hypothetical protein
VNGWDFCTEQQDSMLLKMQEAYKNRHNLQAMGEQGRQLVLQKLTYHSLMEIYLNVFKRLHGDRCIDAHLPGVSA